ncbi:MAG: hypothetical protein K2Y28_08715 [Burkholderiaceae bacterium]|nr:hypothetical protein [Burkholderiaceae bacterium]
MEGIAFAGWQTIALEVHREHGAGDGRSRHNLVKPSSAKETPIWRALQRLWCLLCCSTLPGFYAFFATAPWYVQSAGMAGRPSAISVWNVAQTAAVCAICTAAFRADFPQID